MIIALDFDDVIADPNQALIDFYHAEYDPNAALSKDMYPCNWDVFSGKLEKLKDFLACYAQSEYFDKAPLVAGAYEGVRELKKQGHDLFLISSCSGNKECTLRREKHAERLLGTGVLSDVVTIFPNESKADIVQKKGASILIDDAEKNIADIISKGINGIWFKCAVNSKMMDQVMNGASKEDFKNYVWKFDPQLLRDKAIIANNWKDVVKLVSGIKIK